MAWLLGNRFRLKKNNFITALKWVWVNERITTIWLMVGKILTPFFLFKRIVEMWRPNGANFFLSFSITSLRTFSSHEHLAATGGYIIIICILEDPKMFLANWNYSCKFSDTNDYNVFGKKFDFWHHSQDESHKSHMCFLVVYFFFVTDDNVF